MNSEQTIAPPEINAHVEVYGEQEGEQEAPEGVYSGFVGENASYFAQAFAPLNEVFSNAGPMKIVSEEADYTVVVSVRNADGDEHHEDGVMDVDCAILEADQDSLRECLDVMNHVEDLV